MGATIAASIAQVPLQPIESRALSIFPLIAGALRRLVALGCCGLAACVSLPQVSVHRQEADPASIRIAGSDGSYSAQESTRILRRLGSGATPAILGRHIAFEEAVVGRPFVAGNRVTLLEDGRATYQAMFAAIRAARHDVNLETYIFDDDEEGRRFADLLLEKRASGVEVNVIYDSVGTLSTPRSFFDELRAAGIRVAEFNPVNPLTAKRGWRINNRDHRKLLVVDGRIAFVGGINISGVYSSSSGSSGTDDGKTAKESNWRDTHVEIDGPVARDFQMLFLDTWTKVTGETLPAARYLPRIEARGDNVVHAVDSRAGDPDSPVYSTLMSAVESAAGQVHITEAYFVPDAQTLEVLAAAARRGVDVKLILPGHSDNWPAFQAGRSHYDDLLRAGVQIYERRNRLLHAKTAVIDGIWSSVGSANWDPRSFLHNNELNAVILGRNFGERMEAMFRRDLANSDRVDTEQWARRSPVDRVLENVARLWEYWL